MDSEHATVLETTWIVDSPWLGVRLDHVRFGSSPKAIDFYVVRCPDYAQVVAITADFQLILVEQYRHGSGLVTMELPAGMLDGDDPLDAATRELREEVGGRSEAWSPLGSLLLNGARMHSRAHGFLATGVEFAHDTEHDETESIAVRLVALSEATQMLRSGRIADMGSVAFLGLARLRRPDLPWD